MKVKPVLGDWEIPNIAAIETLERRAFVELPVPGREGSLFQDANTLPTRIAIAGSLHGDETRAEFVDQVRAKFREGEPLSFVADIVTATSVHYVVIDALHFEERGTRPDEVDYTITLRESPPPPPPPDPLGGIDSSLLDQAAGFVDQIAGALDAIDTMSLPEFSDPSPPLEGVLDGVTAVVEGLGGIAGPIGELFGGGE